MYKDLDKDNFNKILADKDAINRSIENILTTKQGTVPGKPDFGCGIFYYVFEHLDHITSSSLQREITRCLRLYEPRIQVNEVNILEQPEFNRIIININYSFTYVQTSEYQTFNLILKG